MATSGITSWDQTRNELIEAAYRKLGIPGEGNTLTATQYTDGLIALNSIVAMAMTDGMPLWKRTTTSLTPSATTQEYSIDAAVKIAHVSLRDTSSGVQYELEQKTLYDFLKLPYNTTGIPVNWIWEPTISGGTLKIYPAKSDAGTVSTKTIIVVYQKEFDGFSTTTTDTLDFPPYWVLPIVYQTAVVLSHENGLPIEDRKELLAIAKQYWAQAASYGDDSTSLYLQPNPKFE